MTDSAAAFSALLLNLRELDTLNRPTPCQTAGVQHLWTSDHHEEREAAGHRCQACPLLDLCTAYADAAGERHHVWAGTDRTPTTRTERNNQ